MVTREIILLSSIALLFIALIYRYRKQDRPSLGSSCTVAVIGLVALLIAWLAENGGLIMIAGVLDETGIVLLGIAFIRLAGMFAFRLILPVLRITPPRILEDVLVVAGYIGWVIVRLRYAGVNPGDLIAASAVMTAIIAFSMQDTLGNILGGIALQLDNSIDIGDWVKVDDNNNGIVEQVGWRSTLLRTRNGEILVVPNSVLMKNRFHILGRLAGSQTQWRRWVWFDCPNDIPPGQVIATVTQALRGANIGNISKHPTLDCLLMGFQGGVCQYAVRYWLNNLWKDDPTDSEVRQHLLAALRRTGIPLALPQYRLRTVAEGEAFDQAKYKRDHAKRLAAVRHVDMFSKLTSEELDTLAGRLLHAPYAAGDVITRQGDIAHWLYLVYSGEADVFLENNDGTRRRIGYLKSGDVFGEMALLTGAPRRATVIARTDMECYRLDKQAFADLIQARPAIAEDVSRILAEREQAINISEENIISKPGNRGTTQLKNEILSSVKRFFSL